MSLDWTTELADQLEWHWSSQLRPRLDGLTDEEYFWEPVPGCWSSRRAGEGRAAARAGAGEFTLDYAFPPPDPAPVTTVAWLLAHVTVGCFAQRAHSHFGGPPASWTDVELAGTAQEALRQLDEAHERWSAGVRGLSAGDLQRPCGPAEGPYADAPLATLVLHVHREVIHHGAEVALLRDLFRWKAEARGV